MLRYMIDTDISSYAMKASNAGVVRRMSLLDNGEACISVITRGELMFGLEVSPRRAKEEPGMMRYLSYAQTLPLPVEVIPEYAAIRADLKRRGRPIGANDIWIAAHARHLGLTLVTNNVREFSRVPGLKIENWSEPA
jgi:tRNA(fMet)-specific endonuclease VapC